jgi:5'-nucleotidase (lipoprotein e(P4) family)
MKKIAVLCIAIFIVGAVFAADGGYVVKEGDTLFQISIETGISVDDLIEYNDLNDANLIIAGQELIVSKYTYEDLNEQLVMSVLWYQTSGEFKALSYQAFNVAKMLFDEDLENYPDETATRAVIVDIDETVLNNIPWEAGQIGTDNTYPYNFVKWCGEKVAEPQPGAAEFLNYVVEKEGEVFYISNRKRILKKMTMDNLKKSGFPDVDEEHVMLSTTTSDKEPRRKIVSENYRIVVLMGDNLNDFSSVFSGESIENRSSSVDQMKEYWGTKFVVLPNPIYGDWEDAVYNWNWNLNAEEKNEERKKHLIVWPAK